MTFIKSNSILGMLKSDMVGAHNRKQDLSTSIVDVFCGAGGLSHGFYQEGFTIEAGIDADKTCAYAFEQNNHSTFVKRDIRTVTAADIRAMFVPNRLQILIGCAPCQPFSTYNQKNSDPQWNLLHHFGQLVKEVKPDIVSMENVPRLTRFRGGKVFTDFLSMLKEKGYHITWDILDASHFGLPQKRTRLVLLASQLGEITMPVASPTPHKTVRQAIESLSPLDAGQTDPEDPLHRAARLSSKNLLRIMNSTPGGTWKDWDTSLIAACHKTDSGKTYSGVYGRMVWDEPAPTITTQYYGFGNGRFGHPEQHRAISLREGAILQGFPKGYKFIAPDKPIYFKTVGRLVGNAVPVTLAKAIAQAIHRHIERYT